MLPTTNESAVSYQGLELQCDALEKGVGTSLLSEIDSLFVHPAFSQKPSNSML